MLYHVSPASGLTVLKPHCSSHEKAYVYALSNRTTALLFGAKHDDFDFLLDQTQEGLPELFECYPGAFRSVYSSKSCSVYEISEAGFMRGVTPWEPELVCEHEVPVLHEEIVADLYMCLQEEQAAGRLLLHSYSSDASYRAMIAGHVTDRLIRFDALEHWQADARLVAHFSPLIQALLSAMDGHLLP